MQVKQLLPHVPPQAEVVVEGQAGKLPQQVHPVVVAVHRVVHHGVGVGEDVLGGDAIGPSQFIESLAPFLPVVVVELPDAPLGDVADPLPVVGVAVEGQALIVSYGMQVNQFVGCQGVEWLVPSGEIDRRVTVSPMVRKDLRHLVSAMRDNRRIVTVLHDEGPVHGAGDVDFRKMNCVSLYQVGFQFGRPFDGPVDPIAQGAAVWRFILEPFPLFTVNLREIHSFRRKSVHVEVVYPLVPVGGDSQ